jgi:hypothetical protein
MASGTSFLTVEINKILGRSVKILDYGFAAEATLGFYFELANNG